MCDITNEHIALLKIKTPFLQFKNIKNEREYIRYSSYYVGRIFLIYLISIASVSGIDLLVEFSFSKDLTKQMKTKIMDALEILIGMFLLLKPCRRIFNKLFEIYFFICLVVEIIEIYIEKANNDTKICVSHYFILTFPLFFSNRSFHKIIIGITIYIFAVIPSIFWNNLELDILPKNIIYNFLPMFYNISISFLGNIIILIVYSYCLELDSRIQYFNHEKCLLESKKDEDVFANLTPQFVREKMNFTNSPLFFDYEDVSILFCDICDFDHLVDSMTPKDLVLLLDNIYNTFDQLCLMHGIQKIETVGKTYMAAGGIRQCERNFIEDSLDKHHAIRVFELAKDMIESIQRLTLENGEGLRIKIGIHVGKVIPAVVGSRKPQFSLIGDAVNTTSRMCSCSYDNCITCSESAYLLIKENKAKFEKITREVKGKGHMNLYLHSPFKNVKFDCNIISVYKINTPRNNLVISPQLIKHPITPKSDEHSLNRIMSNNTNTYDLDTSVCIQDSFNTEGDLKYKKITKSITNHLYSDMENKKAKKGKKNGLFKKSCCFFCFKDHESQRNFKLFEETQFSKCGKQATVINIIFFIVYAFHINNISILVEEFLSFESIMVIGDVFLLFSFLPIIYQTNFLIKSNPYKLRYLCLIIFLIFSIKNHFNFALLNSKYLINCLMFQIIIISTSSYNGILNLNLMTINLMLNVLFCLGNIIYNYPEYYYIKYNIFIVLVCFVTFLFKIMRLYISTHEYLLIQKENTNLKQSEERLFKLVPPHAIQNLKDAIPVVDILYKVTLLYADIVKFTDYSSQREPSEIVRLLTELFDNFDQATERCNVYKVHTIGDCYVVMGFTGKVALDERNYLAEAKNVILMGEEMIKIIRNVRKNFKFEDLDMRIGIHTGTIIAGVIGTQVVRYDIFGTDVLIANKMESNGKPGKINVSEFTKDFIGKEDEGGTFAGYRFEENCTVFLPSVDKTVKTYFVEEDI